MNLKVESLKNRIHKLQQKDAMGNDKIIKKLKRKLRALENE